MMLLLNLSNLAYLIHQVDIILNLHYQSQNSLLKFERYLRHFLVVLGLSNVSIKDTLMQELQSVDERLNYQG
jgi:hypothetical protein